MVQSSRCRDRLLHSIAATSTDLAKVEHRLSKFPEAVWEVRSHDSDSSIENEAIMQVGANGDLPIHRACINKSKAGYQIVRLILASAPELVRRPGRDGALPLHMACANTISVKVVKDLVAMYPGGATLLTDRGDTALHHACINPAEAALEIIRYVLIPNPQALMHPGINGDLPLHLACAIQPSVAVIREMITLDSRALRVCNKFGDLPLHRLCLNQSADMRHLSEVSTLLVFVLARTHPVAKGVPLFPEAIKERGQGANFALHIACGNSNSVDLVKALVEAWPEACLEKNEQGNYPVHCCCMNRNSHVQEPILKVLSEHYPKSCELKGSKGCLPIHTAAEYSGSLEAVQLLILQHKFGAFVKNENGNLPSFCAQRNRSAQARLIREEIFKAYPDAYGEKDASKLHLQVKSLTDNFFPWEEPKELIKELRIQLAGGKVQGAQNPNKKQDEKKPKAGVRLAASSSQLTGRWWTGGLTNDHTCKDGALARLDPHGTPNGFEFCVGNPVRHVDHPHTAASFCIGHRTHNHRPGTFARFGRRPIVPLRPSTSLA